MLCVLLLLSTRWQLLSILHAIFFYFNLHFGWQASGRRKRRIVLTNISVIDAYLFFSSSLSFNPSVSYINDSMMTYVRTQYSSFTHIRFYHKHVIQPKLPLTKKGVFFFVLLSLSMVMTYMYIKGGVWRMCFFLINMSLSSAKTNKFLLFILAFEQNKFHGRKS